MEPVYDMLGAEVKVGDRIAYAVTQGRSAWMRVGHVTEFHETKGRDPYWTIVIQSDVSTAYGPTGSKETSTKSRIRASYKKYVVIPE